MAKAATARRDTSIETYEAKRDFTATSEPAPSKRHGRAAKSGPIFVVQKHRAHRAGLHWDFRLEHNGVLWSWAVRKGPSMDSADKRIAAHVEDHPLDYADFQGTIPDGHYGAGTVETWDRGTWEPLIDPDAGYVTYEGAGSGKVDHRTTLAERIGPRARSRLFEMCRVIKMPSLGDYRVRKQGV